MCRLKKKKGNNYFFPSLSLCLNSKPWWPCSFCKTCLPLWLSSQCTVACSNDCLLKSSLASRHWAFPWSHHLRVLKKSEADPYLPYLLFSTPCWMLPLLFLSSARFILELNPELIAHKERVIWISQPGRYNLSYLMLFNIGQIGKYSWSCNFKNGKSPFTEPIFLFAQCCSFCNQ